MDGKILSLFLATVLLLAVQVSGFSKIYRGAVVEYFPEKVLASEEQQVAKNVKNYIKFMQEAHSKKVDIIVFPEMGLLTEKIASQIPDPVDQIVPCESDFETTEIVKDLSRASKENQIYSVVNLLEKRMCNADAESCPRGYYLYNTNVVFDRRGAVIARYAKYNLFDENELNRTKSPEIVFFDTDFGVRFGTFICFDILFHTPPLKLIQQYKINDFIFPTFWFSELPFLTALQAQRGWAESNNVNLLASGVLDPRRGSGGSGIYNGKYGELVQILSEDQTSKLLIADIPTIEIHQQIDSCETNGSKIYGTPTTTIKEVVKKKEPLVDLNLLQDQIFLFNSKVIETGKLFEETVCSSSNFCCDFRTNIDAVDVDARNFTYRAAVYNGIRKFGSKFEGGVQICGVILCNGPDIKNCTSRVKNLSDLFYIHEIRIRGDFKRTNSLQIPSTLTDRNRLEPLPANKYEFVKKEKKGSVDVSLELLWPVTHLHTFAIWGRDFTRDDEPKVPRASSSLVVSAPYLIATFIGFTIFAR